MHPRFPRRSGFAARFAAGLVAATALAGCSGDEAATVGSTTSVVSVDPTTTSGQPPTTGATLSDEATAVLKAYAGHWRTFYAFINGAGPGDPADYFTGARLADLPGQIAGNSERGLEARGEPQLNPGQVTVDGNRATFTDCQLDLSFAVSRSTGEVVIPPSTKPQRVAVGMVKSGGVWKVSSVVYSPEGSCR